MLTAEQASELAGHIMALAAQAADARSTIDATRACASAAHDLALVAELDADLKRRAVAA